MPDKPSSAGILLAHGSGAGQDHPWIIAMRGLLAARGYPTMTFNYDYIESGRRGPDRPDRLLAVHSAAADRLATYVDEVVLAGKSMGGRMASHLVGDQRWPAVAIAYFGYPLVAMGKGEPRPVDHLHRISMPQYFVCGTRDRLSPPVLIESLVCSLPNAFRFVVEDGDHSLQVPKRAGITNKEVLANVASATTRWIRDSIA